MTCVFPPCVGTFQACNWVTASQCEPYVHSPAKISRRRLPFATAPWAECGLTLPGTLKSG